MLWLAAEGQPQSFVPMDTSAKSQAYWHGWLKDLNEIGVDKSNDSLMLNEEVVQLIQDSSYRNSIYPVKYEWGLAVDLLNRMELKKAFWHMINLYRVDTVHRNLVVGSFILYDSIMDMERVLLATFYTYAFTDPEVGRILNGKPEILRPDIMESKLGSTREIIAYIWNYRKRMANKP
jgi:hypothetical protein